MEKDPLQYIEGAEPVDVPDTSYYRRRMAAEELLVSEKQTRGSAKQAAKEPTE
jgi:Txe/YoeB family toxin of Txe-Axe toxin-antitoxin module